MSKQKSGRVAWQCPNCGRKFRIPPNATPPSLCPECNEQTADDQPNVGKLVPSPAVIEQMIEETQPSKENKPRSSTEQLPSDVEDYIAKQERQQILEHLENISKTMTFFRRLVWSMVLMMFLYGGLIGVGLYFSFQQLGSLTGLLNKPVVVPAAANGQHNNIQNNPELENLGENLKQISDLYKDLQSQ